MSKFTDFLRCQVTGDENGTVPDLWTRPSDWLELPEIEPTDQMFVGLYAIKEEANFCALIAAGNYTVDWGDGTVENYAANAQAEHVYDYGSPTLDDTECSRGYKQAIVRVYPQAGNNLTALNLNVRHSQIHSSSFTSNRFLDIIIASSRMNTLEISANISSVKARFLLLERVQILSCGAFNFSNLFTDCKNLRTLAISGTPNVTDASSMLANCESLLSLSFPSSGTVTSFASMLFGCQRLELIDALDTSSGVEFNSMFYGCRSLETIPLLNTGKGTNFNSMFSGCSLLKTIPPINTSAGKDFGYMFSNCQSLTSLPEMDFSAATVVGSAFDRTFSLTQSEVLGPPMTHSYLDSYLSGEALNEIYRRLPTVTGTVYIAVSRNWGFAASDKTIATGKGWTVN